MCGIVGSVGDFSLDTLKTSLASISHRGADNSSFFYEDRIFLGHNRLSIIDLDKEANQPFFIDGFGIVFNGEIYNYLEIRDELIANGEVFRTKSDTEVLLRAYMKWGVGCLERFNGDFAFCIMDRYKKQLILARDRLGNKPLFFTNSKDGFFFASEIRAFKSVVNLEFDMYKITNAIVLNINDYSEKTIYKNIYNLPPASYMIFDLDSKKLKTHKYWGLDVAEDRRDFDEVDFKKRVASFEELFSDSLKMRLRADVPISILVSGGLDSSLIAAFAKELDSDSKYITATFPQYKDTDESHFVDLLEKDLGIDVLRVEPEISDILKDFDDLVKTHSDIFRSLSIYVQFCVFRELSRYSKVSISGQGADELFGGYFHHVARAVYGSSLELEARKKIIGKEACREFEFGKKLHLDTHQKRDWLLQDNLKQIELFCDLEESFLDIDLLLEKFNSSLFTSLINDTLYYNLTSLLRYEDRNAMRFSVENRTPFTDYRLVEFAHNLPISYRFRNGYSKYFLRAVLEKYVSKEIAYRVDKMGFCAPEVEWMGALGIEPKTLVGFRYFLYQKLRGLYDMG